MPKRDSTSSSQLSVEETSIRYRGWRVVIACFVTAVCAWGTGFYGLSVFIAHLRVQHEWSGTLVSTATTFYFLVSSFFVAFLDDAIRRFGPRVVVLTGLSALATSTCLIGHINSIWQLFAVYLLMALGWSCASLGAIVNILGQWFGARRGMAISLALNGAGVGGMIFPMLLFSLSDRLGFVSALYMSVVPLFAVALVLVALWVDRNSNMPTRHQALQPQPARGQKLRVLSTSRFWSIALPFALGVAVQVGIIVHLVSALEPTIGRAASGSAVAIVGATAILGRLALSFVIDQIAPRILTSILLLVQGGSICILPVIDSLFIINVACIGFGIGVGNLITLPALIVQRECNPTSFGLITGLVTAIMGLTWAIFPMIIGFLSDVTGSYRAPFIGACGIDVIAALLAFRWPIRMETEQLG